MTQPLVLSLFPGIGLLDRAFEEEGFCVVRGPDLLWGGDVRSFHPPRDRFDGVIGGPPCQAHSRMANIVRANGYKVAEDLIPEFARCVRESSPTWWVMENVQGAPVPRIGDYHTHSQLLNNRWLGEVQNRLRRWTFGTRDGRRISVPTVALEAHDFEPAVLANGMRQVDVKFGGSGKLKPRGRQTTGRRRSLEESSLLQGLPPDFLKDAPFTVAGKQRAIGNGVPLAMGRAIAKAVRRAMYPETTEASA